MRMRMLSVVLQYWVISIFRLRLGALGVRGEWARACPWRRTRGITARPRLEGEAVSAGTRPGEASSQSQASTDDSWPMTGRQYPVHCSTATVWPHCPFITKSIGKEAYLIGSRSMHCFSVMCFYIDRCGMGEILDCLKKIKLDINSLKTRVEELSDNQTRSFNKTESDKQENDKIIRTLTKKINSVKQIVEPISGEYIRNRSVIHEYKIQKH